MSTNTDNPNPEAVWVPLPLSIRQLTVKYGDLDGCIDAYLDRKLSREEDEHFTWHAKFAPAIMRRMFERMTGRGERCKHNWLKHPDWRVEVCPRCRLVRGSSRADFLGFLAQVHEIRGKEQAQSYRFLMQAADPTERP